MKRAAAVLCVGSVAGGVLAASSASLGFRSSRVPPAAPAGQIVFFGHIKSLSWTHGRFELRFDPALWLGGVTAQRAAVEDGAIRAGQPVPNDYYIVDEGHRALTFVVPAAARVSVLDRAIHPVRVPVAELAQIVAGRNPKHRPLFGGGRNGLGYWLRAEVDRVQSLQQQYQP